MVTDNLDKALEEIRETAKGSDKERLNRLELGMQEFKRRLSRLEENSRKGDDE